MNSIKQILEDNFGHSIVETDRSVICTLCDSHFMFYGGDARIMIWENGHIDNEIKYYDRWYCCWRANGSRCKEHTCKELTIKNLIE